MKAVIIKEHGGPQTLSVSEIESPVIRPGYSLIKVKACSLNHLDTWVRRGVPGHRFPLPIIPGSDVAGVVVEGGKEFPPGSEVVVAPFITCLSCPACVSGNDVQCKEYKILGESINGGCAEYLLVPETSLYKKPDNLTFTEASTMLLAPLTAYHMLVTRAQVTKGERILIFASAGGVGIFAVQIAKALGATVFGVVGAEYKKETVLRAGADEVVVVPHDKDPLPIIREKFPKTYFDVVVDSVGGRSFEAGLYLLKGFGRLVTCGATSGLNPTIDIRRLFFKSLSVLGSTMGNRSDLRAVLSMASNAQIKPFIYAELPLEQIAEAHRLIEEGRVVGKVVITL